ncbi:hypothetical protein M433DRAFT_68822 [Acidomyces richmondensis BFW]|nr:MAG: hypothetical protein FE78DRAFT_151105 [Acidomyces sp. 'richmondensis']KYG44703.1 hypothetical protein M433DRAFT_68822 [Acidomyces richmondensis BFW]
MPKSRSRSASPQRDLDTAPPRPKKQKTVGFKWKQKRPHDNDSGQDRDSGTLERGYRNRSPLRESYRDRDKDRDNDSYRPSRDDDRLREDEASPPMDRSKDAAVSETPKGKTEKKKKPKPVAPVSSEPMIVVNVNDRLGTKAAIPCLASDSIKSFKAMVAAKVGRAPHEILLKRQGERPFKDQLTLEDYGVSNGVQLDLELDTGD